MAYNQTTLAQLTTMLSIRLNSQGFWTPNELRRYIIEALRTWQSFSQSYTTRVSIPTQPNVFFYDLFKLIPSLTPSITDQEIIIDVQQALQEPVSPTSWIGTEQYTYQGVVNAIQRSRNKFLLETGMVNSVFELPGPVPNTGTMSLNPSTIDVRRVMWKDRFGNYSLMFESDEYTLSAANPNWFTTPGLPTDYTTLLQQPLVMQLSPPPLDIGMVNLITVESLPDLTPSASPTILGIPDDFCWVIKFGALADLFWQDGPGQDESRAQYCDNRWQEGIKLARTSNFIRFGFQSGVPSFVDSIEEIDATEPTWMMKPPGIPTSLGVSGNIAMTTPIPDNQPHSMAFDIIPAFPIPGVTPGSNGFVQAGREVLDVIVDYAQHLAYIKEGSLELKQSSGLYKNMMMLAAVQNDRFRAMSVNFDVLSDRSEREKKESPRRRSDTQLKELDYEE